MLSHAQFSADHYGHLKQLPLIKDCLSQFDAIAKELPIDQSPAFTALVQRIQVHHFLFTLNEINEAILQSAGIGSYTAAEALARVSIEMSANLLFVLGGNAHGRAKGLLKYHIETSKARVDKWSKFAARSELPSVQRAADEQFQMFSNLESQFVGLTESPFEKWPDKSFTKFAAIGHEERYRTLFASSSDSIHLMGADILNLVLCNFEPKSEQPAVIKHIHSEKASFAVYLLVASTLFQAECLHAVIHRVGETGESLATVRRCHTQLAELLQTHESDTKKHLRNDES